MEWGCITRVPGVRVGLVTDSAALTGVAVTLFDGGAVGSVSVLGGAPGTSGTDALRALQNNQELHAVVLTGGSVFGLASVHGVVRYLWERGVGVRTRHARVPIVAGAVVYDLGLGAANVHPTDAMGYQAAASAAAAPVPCGNTGPGAGASTGKWRGGARLKGGLGSASLDLACGIVVGALVVVNAIGDVINPETGQFYATHGGFAASGVARVADWSGAGGFLPPPAPPEGSIENTTIALLATNALLDKTQLARVAVQAHDGLARCIRPVHTSGDGDTVFVVSVGGSGRTDLRGAVTGVYSDVIGSAAADVLTRATLRAVLEAAAVPGILSARDRYPDLVPPVEGAEFDPGSPP